MAKKKRRTVDFVPKTVTLDCPRCNAIVEAKVAGQYAHFQEGPDVPIRYLLAQCPRCDGPMVAAQENNGDWDNDHDYDEPARVLPARSRVGTGVPKPVAGAFDEASRCYGARAYTATAIMCRKALEALVKEHKVTARNLAAALKKMRDQGLIEARLFEWADGLRLAGNDAAHDAAETMSREDAKDMLDFAGALIEYVFTFRDRFDAFKQRRASKTPSPNKVMKPIAVPTVDLKT
jgi:hypothetical protein